jgi:3-deoxy-D-manno-octulosonic-acid transferase
MKLQHARLSNPAKASLQILVVDAHGLLSRIYRLADLAYVGGGFGEAVHNTLEPAAYGIPVIFGPNNAKFLEIQGLKHSGAGIEIRNQEDLNNTVDLLISDEEKRRELGAVAGAFVQDRSGGTQTILKSLLSHLPEGAS